MNIIILGCGRSGTSIFGELFEALPGFRYYFEPRLEQLATVDYDAGPVVIKVPKATLGTPMTPGLPFLLSDLRRLVPEPMTIFWQVRHPLDAICSLRPGIDANWAHNPRPPDWESWLDRPLIERCARHWSFINGDGFREVRQSATVYRYEDMIADPAGTARRACAEIGLGLTDVEPAITKWSSLVTNRKSSASYEAKYQVLWSRPDHSVRSGRWRENLSVEEVRSVLPIVSAPAANFDYTLPHRRLLWLTAQWARWGRRSADSHE